jgi:hypothetical protein
MPITDFASEIVDREVERLFKEHPPVHGQICRHPVLPYSYVGGLDPTKKQKDVARRALLARVWFSINGPADAQPLPLGMYDDKVSENRYTLLGHIVEKYARSLDGRDFDFHEHPPFADYVAGFLWEGELTEGSFAYLSNDPPEELAELKKRFPPQMLKGMSAGACWLPPEKHQKAMTNLRRFAKDGEVYFNRE